MNKNKQILFILLLTILLLLEGCASLENSNIVKYTINISECTNGVVTCDELSASSGDNIELSISPADGYILKNGSLKYNDHIISSNTFVMPSTNITITCEFIEEINEKYTNLSYGDNAIQKYDLYVSPSALENSNVGVLIFIHGGFWVGGTKEYYKEYVEEYVTEYPDNIVVNMDYHLIIPLVNSGISMYTMLDDITLCISDVKNIMYEYGIDLSGVALGGHSAGGHLAMMYSYTRQSSAPLPIKFCATFSGPADFSDPELLKYRETEYEEGTIQGQTIDSIMYNLAGFSNIEETLANVDTFSPTSFISATSLPTIMAYGEKDRLVPFSNATILDATLTSYNVDHEFITFPNSGHSLQSDVDKTSYLYQTIDDYAKRLF